MRNALAIYERLAALEPELATAHIRLARAFWWYAMLRPGADRNERRDLFRRGASAARRAQQLVPLDPGGYFWEAANRVHASTIEGGLVPPDEILRIRKLVRKVHRLNSWYHHGSIRYVEAEMILKLPTLQRWLIARNLQSGIDLALGALGFENNCFYGHWVLARALAAAGRRSAAIAQLDFILGADPESFLPDAPENRAVMRWSLVLREELEAGG
jgi:hypothetical protein